MPNTKITAAYSLAMAMYLKEPCRVCGQEITEDDLSGIVYAGYSKGNLSRAAHEECYESRLPQSRWRYPINDGEESTKFTPTIVRNHKHDQKWALTRLVGRVHRLKRAAIAGVPKLIIFNEINLIQKCLGDLIMYFHRSKYPEEPVTYKDWEAMEDDV